MSREPHLPKRGDLIAGKYLVDGPLGSGGMSAVFKVSHRVTHKLFALKWMLPSLRYEQDAVQRFIREAQVAGCVDHPNVVEVYDVGEQEDSLYMVMEFLQGESLASRLASGRLTPAEACELLVPTARGLSAVHAAGVVHRDLKPQNIFLARDADQAITPKVLDFGISKMSRLHGEPSAAITREGMIIGTPHYMSPEQVLGKHVDERTDVYALGVILYEALTGELPFTGGSYGDLAIKITTDTPRPIVELAPETPRALVAAVNRAMARDPAQRFATADAFAEALSQLANDLDADVPLAYSPTRPGLSPSEPCTPLSTVSRQLPRAAKRRDPRSTILLIAGAICGSIAISIGVSLRRDALERSRTVPPASAEVSETSVLAASNAAAVKASSMPAAEDLPPSAAVSVILPAPPVEPAPVPDKLASPHVRVSAATQAAELRAKPPSHPAQREPSAALPAATPIPAPVPVPGMDPSRRSKRRTHALTEADF